MSLGQFLRWKWKLHGYLISSKNWMHDPLSVCMSVCMSCHVWINAISCFRQCRSDWASCLQSEILNNMVWTLDKQGHGLPLFVQCLKCCFLFCFIILKTLGLFPSKIFWINQILSTMEHFLLLVSTHANGVPFFNISLIANGHFLISIAAEICFGHVYNTILTLCLLFCQH